MPNYRVIVCYYASEMVEVEADSPEAAADAGYNEGRAGLCHQCASNIDLSDPYKAIVCDEDGNEVYCDEDSANG